MALFFNVFDVSARAFVCGIKTNICPSYNRCAQIADVTQIVHLPIDYFSVENTIHWEVSLCAYPSRIMKINLLFECKAELYVCIFTTTEKFTIHYILYIGITFVHIYV